MINFSVNSTATSKQIRYINGLFSLLKRKNIEHQYIDSLSEHNGKKIDKNQASQILSELELIIQKHNEMDIFWEDGKNQINKSGIFDVINQRNYKKDISNIIVNWDKHIIDPNYGYDNKSMLVRIPLNLADLTSEQKLNIDTNKKYYLEFVCVKANWDNELETSKIGLIYRIKNNRINDISSGKYVTIDNSRFVIIGLNLKHKQWKRILDEQGNIIALDENVTSTGKFFEYHGKFWNSLSDVVEEYHKEAIILLNKAQNKLNNIVENIGVYKEFINVFEYSKQELEKIKDDFNRTTNILESPPDG
ncbi:hypothetical protein [Spiroplasma taiwanense]|uniref:Uncharacterized protein n=1 Tax=Spiroplasma taiwanense CT-1 TaxID=1276220 RepID=S5LV83_9MOLU|nr:hypothetical protein [Spiroplasma taiwanense]AGR41689.1 hypothetical protein STAIW_v1c11060 [Spiroplasma taiwanense CT-1]